MDLIIKKEKKKKDWYRIYDKDHHGKLVAVFQICEGAEAVKCLNFYKHINLENPTGWIGKKGECGGFHVNFSKEDIRHYHVDCISQGVEMPAGAQMAVLSKKYVKKFPCACDRCGREIK